MRTLLALGCALVLAVCAKPDVPAAVPSERPGRAPAALPTTRLVLPAARDRDCADFRRRADAQDALDRDPTDPHRLDADKDGLACERLRR